MLEWLRVVWLTPAMDALFTGPAGDRRRFLDRLVLAIDGGHGQRALDYEKAMRGRNRLLTEGSRNDAWFEAIEMQMAETGVAIAAARAELVRLLTSMIDRLPDDGPFPQAELVLSGALEEQVGTRLRSMSRSGFAGCSPPDASATVPPGARWTVRIAPTSSCATGPRRCRPNSARPASKRRCWSASCFRMRG